MPVGRKERTGPRDGTAPGWNSRTKLDQGKGGIKVLNGADIQEEDNSHRRLKRNQSDVVVGRRTRRPEGNEFPNQLRKTRSDSQRVSASEEHCKTLIVCRDNKIPNTLSNAAQRRPSTSVKDESNEKDEEEEEVEGEALEEEKEADKYDVKEMNSVTEVEQDHVPFEIPPTASKKPLATVEHPSVDRDLVKPPPTPTPVAEEACENKLTVETEVENWDFAEEDSFVSKSEIQSKMQNLVDLVMWKDISKSALMFGFGSFIIISSSFAEDLNFSFVSVISYMGLIYLSVAFIRRSILLRGTTDFEELHKNMIGEREAIWLVRMILPYLNEILFTLKTLFSGDPATTVKLAIVLYILARCGSSVTIWAMTKLAFFGAFTMPKMYRAYSTQLSAYGKFWIRRFRDAWDSCTHKKAVAAAVFTVIWNLSSVIARIWAVFILIVVVKFYQQSIQLDDEGKEDVTVGTDYTDGTVRQEGSTHEEVVPASSETRKRRSSREPYA